MFNIDLFDKWTDVIEQDIEIIQKWTATHLELLKLGSGVIGIITIIIIILIILMISIII